MGTKKVKYPLTEAALKDALPYPELQALGFVHITVGYGSTPRESMHLEQALESLEYGGKRPRKYRLAVTANGPEICIPKSKHRTGKQ